MVSEPEIRFASGVDEVTITLHDCLSADSVELWDRNAVAATIRAVSGTFHGHVTTTIWLQELMLLHQLLIDLAQDIGQVMQMRWAMLEDALSLMFQMDRLGHIRISVEVGDSHSVTQLTFSIDADQTYLALWRQQIAQALSSLVPQNSV